MKQIVNLLIFLILLLSNQFISSAPNFGFDSTNTFLGDGKIIDINNPNQEDIREFEELKVNITVLREQQANLKNRHNHNGQIASDQAIDPSNNLEQQQLNESSPQQMARKQYEQDALDAIKRTLERTILFNNTHDNPPSLSSGDVNHYTAAHPQCSTRHLNSTPVTVTNESAWNLYFSPPTNENPQNAILRLYKVATEKSYNKANCSDQEELIRITVSFYSRKRKDEKRKKLCSSLMVARYYVGWIELDVKAAVKYWKRPVNNQQKKNLKLAIDVQDQEENFLQAEGFFHPYSCEVNNKRFPGIILLNKEPVLWTTPCHEVPV